MRTHIRALVALYTVFWIPLWNESFNAALLVGCCAVLPCSVNSVVLYEVAHFQQVAHLSVDRFNEFVDECRCFRLLRFLVWQVSPLWIYFEFMIFVASVYSCVVLVYYVLTFLSIRLFNEGTHLLHRQVYRNNVGYAEEGRLQYCVCTVSKPNFLCYLCCIDIIYIDIVLCKIALYVVWYEVY